MNLRDLDVESLVRVHSALLEQEIMNLLHALEHQIILNDLAPIQHCSHGHIILNGAFGGLLMLPENHIHHELHLIKSLFIE